jgi:hypothetical protein
MQGDGSGGDSIYGGKVRGACQALKLHKKPWMVLLLPAVHRAAVTQPLLRSSRMNRQR